MRIKRIYNRNLGPVENMNIEFHMNSDNTPKPVILVGENGTGKSTVLSNIVDSFYEMAGKAYRNVRERDGDGYQNYKAIVSSEIKIGQNFMLSFIEFSESDNENIVCQYVFKGGKLEYDEFVRETGVDELNIKNKWKNENNIKDIIVLKEDVQKNFDRNVFCYFGPERYEKPQ